MLCACIKRSIAFVIVVSMQFGMRCEEVLFIAIATTTYVNYSKLQCVSIVQSRLALSCMEISVVR